MCANTRMFSLAVPVQRLCILQQNGATDTAPGGPRGADRGPRPKAQGLTLSPRLPVHLPCSEHCHALGPLVLSPRHSLWYRQTATQTLEVACEASSQMRVFLSLSADVTAEPGRVTCPWPPSSSYLPLPERHGSPTWHTLQSRWHSLRARGVQSHALHAELSPPLCRTLQALLATGTSWLSSASVPQLHLALSHLLLLCPLSSTACIARCICCLLSSLSSAKTWGGGVEQKWEEGGVW